MKIFEILPSTVILSTHFVFAIGIANYSISDSISM